MVSRALLLPCLALLCLALAPQRSLAGSPPLLLGKRSGSVIHYEMHVRVAKGGPDCFTRDVILVNGLFQPTIEAFINDTLVVNVFNEIPKDFPQVADGISIHWHGLYMWDEAKWYDGAAYVTQCPISRGTNYTYSFLLNEAPGTYMWHDHSTADTANGLHGALIIKTPPEMAVPYGNGSAPEHILFINDWFHSEGNVMAMRANRPVMADRINNNTGYFQGIPAPNALLINGKGFYGDCNADSSSKGANGYLVPSCNPQAYSFAAPIPGAGGASKGCGHETFRVTPGETYLLRLINSCTSSYVTVCFDQHMVTMVTADTSPVEWTDYECIDINSGERYDVMLKASTEPEFAGKNFWISVHGQYMHMVPSTYAVLQYDGAPEETWPLTPAPQPGVLPFTSDQLMQIFSHDGLLGYLDDWTYWTYFLTFWKNGQWDPVSISQPANHTITLNMTQPVITSTGMIRWAMNNIAMPTSPPCKPLMTSILHDPNWLKKYTVNSSSLKAVQAANEAMARIREEAGPSDKPNVFIDGELAPKIPLVGLHIASIGTSDIVEIVLNNRPSNEGNADYNQSSTMMVQHPMHLHGHRFWLLGIGKGVFSRAIHGHLLNYFNPAFKDTMTLPVGSWAVLRIFANNPGVWPFHCHVLWHQFLGQQMYFVESRELWPAPPKRMPKCSSKCTYNFAPFTNKAITRKYGTSEANKHELPTDLM